MYKDTEQKLEDSGQCSRILDNGSRRLDSSARRLDSSVRRPDSSSRRLDSSSWKLDSSLRKKSFWVQMFLHFKISQMVLDMQTIPMLCLVIRLKQTQWSKMFIN